MALFALALTVGACSSGSNDIQDRLATGASSDTSCTAWNPQDGKTYSQIDVHAHGGGSLSFPTIVMDVWGGISRADLEKDLVTLLTDPSFAFRLQQYGVSGLSVETNAHANQPQMNNNSRLTDADIQTAIDQDIRNGMNAGLGTQFGDFINLIFLPDGAITTHDTCNPLCFVTTGFAGYHASYYSSVDRRRVIYAVLRGGDLTGMMVTAAHEIMEAATNPYPGTGENGFWSDRPNAADVLAVGGSAEVPQEIGDLCDGEIAYYSGVPGQQVWLQDQCRCNYEDAYTEPTGCDIIEPGQGLRLGKSFSSCDGRFTLTLQGDGNLVLNMNTGRSGPFASTYQLWASNTSTNQGSTGGHAALMQHDGNFVLYDATMKPLWSSATYGNREAYLSVQNDGNLVVYSATPPNPFLWASNTCCH
jgi:hypothetical protein